MNKKALFFIILGVTVILVILIAPRSLSNLVHCRCGGCCTGCPGDCNTIGAPFAYYYYGINGISQEKINKINIPGIILDGIILAVLIAIIYRIVSGKKSIKK